MNIVNHKKTILIIILVIIAFFAYWFLFVSKKDNTKNANQNVKPQGVVSNTQYDKDFVSSLLGLSSVSLDNSILQSKTYQALNYPETPFVVNYSMESGRNNPFLPIGIDTSVKSISNVQNQEVINNTEVNTNPDTAAPIATTTNTVRPTPKKF